MTIQFGYYPREYNRTMGDITIATLPGLDDAVAGITGSDLIHNGWIWVQPPAHSRGFGLRKTHTLTYARPTSDAHLDFLLWCFGYFEGMRITGTEAGFLDATPVERGKMSDIVWLGDSLEKAMVHADAFWWKHAGNPQIAKALAGAIHTSFLAQKPGLLDYEEFIWLYTALEGCHFVQETIAGVDPPRKTPHYDRIAKLCRTHHIVADSDENNVPTWADPNGTTTTPITALRNATMHDGLFLEEPLGFAAVGGSGDLPNYVLGSMLQLVRRVLMSLLEVPATKYIRSSLTNRTKEGVSL